MRICDACGRCYEDFVASCGEKGHPPLAKTRNGSCGMIAGFHLDRLLETDVAGDSYRAHHVVTGRPCLVRIYLPDERSPQLFLEQAAQSAALIHPNVMNVYRAGSLDSGELFVVEEEPAGRTPMLTGKKRGPSRGLRALAIGSGALAIIGFAILSSIFIGISDTTAENLRAGAMNRLPENLRAVKVPGPFAILPVETGESLAVRALVRSASAAPPRAILAAARMRRAVRRHLLMTKFVPTTLVIYAENGVVKQRIEPQLTAVYKRLSPL